MRFTLFTHSMVSCWNHGNAHFLRGVVTELLRRGHQASVLEPRGGWSRANLLADHGQPALDAFANDFPHLSSQIFEPEDAPEALTEDADVVIVHEWNDPALVASLGRQRRRGGRFTLLFHDTHHRVASDPDAMRGYDLSGYDGVLAFGQVLANAYRVLGWGRQVHVWHEAADTTLFRPPSTEGERAGVVWIGNWGDGERTRELDEFLLEPARALDVPLDVYGVRYPDDARAMLDRAGARYHGWLPNARAPAVFARHAATIHVPRRFYAGVLHGIPTIRVFEALACGIPLLSAPWSDSEHLFRPGQDFLFADTGAAMRRALRDVLNDAGLRAELARSGLETIRARHTCAHRVDELLAILAAPSQSRPAEAAACT